MCVPGVCNDKVNQIPLLSPLLNTPLAVDTDTRLLVFRKVSSMRYRVDTQEQPHTYRPHYPPTSEPL
jgi:hypothetical protein